MKAIYVCECCHKPYEVQTGESNEQVKEKLEQAVEGLTKENCIVVCNSCYLELVKLSTMSPETKH